MSRAIENKFADNVPAWHGMAGPPSEVQESYKEHDLPNLPVMVVDQQKRRPAEGWYAQFDLLYPELAQLDNVEKRNKAKDSVLACTDWSALYHHYGIEDTAPEVAVERETMLRLYVEGSQQATLKAREEAKRSFMARKECLKLKGTACLICGLTPRRPMASQESSKSTTCTRWLTAERGSQTPPRTSSPYAPTATESSIAETTASTRPTR